MVTWRYEISLLMLKKIFHSFASLTREIFFNTRREIFLSPWGHVLLFLLHNPMKQGFLGRFSTMYQGDLLSTIFKQ